MTIAIAWIRKVRDWEELVFVSDSRLSGDGRNLDVSPKILTLPRADCAICFGGETEHAFPMMLQLALAIDAHWPTRQGSFPLNKLKKHALQVFGGMAEFIESTVQPPQSELPGAHFLFGGYCWIKKKFELWSIRYIPADKRFVAQPAQWLSYSQKSHDAVLRFSSEIERTRPIARVAFAGDQSKVAASLLLRRVADAEEKGQALTSLNMELFAVVRDMLRNPQLRDPEYPHTIGGAPQVVKVFQYMKTAPVAVYWPDKESGRIHLQGRPCLGYEQIDRTILDPDTFSVEHRVYAPRDQHNVIEDTTNQDETESREE
jgi:hypothetical protein